jgi:glycosyltransferase involved in cell wall biosynthesis
MKAYFSTQNRNNSSFSLVNSASAPVVPIKKAKMGVKVSAVLITYNEESIISKTLSRLWWCDEILIVDSGSTDKTIDICNRHKCTIIYHPFISYGDQKNFGVSQAKNNWILCLDADEVLTYDLIEEIHRELSKPEIHYSGFSIPLKLVFMNQPFRFGKEAHCPTVRIFDRTKGEWDRAIVHEKLCISGKTKQLHHQILHYSYRDYAHFIAKINLYSSLGAQKLRVQNSGKSTWYIILALPFNFIKYYFIDRNFLNGYKGFEWSLLNTVYHFLKHVKAREEAKR